jgi:phosphoribosylformylglycinamidine synthase
MCVGLVPKGRIATAAASTVGHILVLVGAETGRDGIHGASGLASRAFEDETELRPTVQVGNPFLEKVLIESCLEALATGLVAGLQDLGAAGLTSAAIESVARGGRGLELDIAQVHRREKGMTAYEVMLSESQERMLLVVAPENVAEVKKVFDKWDVTCRPIGRVSQEPWARISDGQNPLVHLPIDHLSEAPRYRLRGEPTSAQIERQRLKLSDVPLPTQKTAEVLLKLLASPNIASKQGVYRQYDHQVQTNTVVGPGSDAAVLRIKGTGKAIALAIDGNGRYCYLDPFRGGQIAVAEVCRNLSCSGAEPLALTDCLNFANPERPEVYHQLEQCIRGMARACRVLGVPVVSGNVSLYNEAMGQAIYPTPVLGGLGLLEDATRHSRAGFPGAGLTVVLLGGEDLRPRPADLAGSEYLQLLHGRVAGRPAISLGLERRVQQLCRQAIRTGVVVSAHDCSDGGLAVALAEGCILGEVGFQGSAGLSRLPRRWDAALFGERQSRIVVSLPPERQATLGKLAAGLGVPMLELGVTAGSRLRIGGHLDLPVPEIADAWSNGLERALAG